MSRSQIHRDVYRRISERLKQWSQDASDLYEMAELTPGDFETDMLTLGMGIVARSIIKHDLPLGEVTSDIAAMVVRYRRHKAAEQ